jgi:hypothetical protein
MTRPTCKLCRSFEAPTDPENKKTLVGWCHRMPPQIYDNGRSSAFPPVSGDKSWCDEFEAVGGPSDVDELLAQARFQP